MYRQFLSTQTAEFSVHVYVNLCISSYDFFTHTQTHSVCMLVIKLPSVMEGGHKLKQE